jgi:signal recognition particle subunit SEC65
MLEVTYLARRAILWPEYLLGHVSRNRGRKLPLRLSTDNITPEKILNACEEIGLKCVIEEGKKFPRVGDRSLGFRVIIELPEEEKVRKSELLKKLGEVLARSTRQ